MRYSDSLTVSYCKKFTFMNSACRNSSPYSSFLWFFYLHTIRHFTLSVVLVTTFQVGSATWPLFSMLRRNIWRKLRLKTNTSYILIRCPAQPNIKHLSCNKQPLMGCVNTSRVWPSLLCLVNQNCLELLTMSPQKLITKTEIQSNKNA